MRVAFECNTNILSMVQPFADFDWILVDKYLTDEKYAKWYRESTNVKFVDNSVTEKGEPCGVDELKQVFEDCKGTYVIAPDWINDYEQTVQAYAECCKTFPIEQVVGVLQGSTPEEALKCLDVYQHQLVAVPYRVGGSKKGDPNELMSLRRSLVVSNIPADRFVHLLGFTAMSEFSWYLTRPNVVSIDTDVPIRAGLQSVDTEELDRTQPTPETKLTQETWAGICRNIALFRKALVP